MKGATAYNKLYCKGNKFQSTLPMKGATDNLKLGYGGTKISIHAPNEGSDRPEKRFLATIYNFNPRSQ